MCIFANICNARPMGTFPATEHLCMLTGTQLYSWVTGAPVVMAYNAAKPQPRLDPVTSLLQDRCPTHCCPFLSCPMFFQMYNKALGDIALCPWCTVFLVAVTEWNDCSVQLLPSHT